MQILLYSPLNLLKKKRLLLGSKPLFGSCFFPPFYTYMNLNDPKISKKRKNSQKANFTSKQAAQSHMQVEKHNNSLGNTWLRKSILYVSLSKILCQQKLCQIRNCPLIVSYVKNFFFVTQCSLALKFVYLAQTTIFTRESGCLVNSLKNLLNF